MRSPSPTAWPSHKILLRPAHRCRVSTRPDAGRCVRPAFQSPYPPAGIAAPETGRCFCQRPCVRPYRSVLRRVLPVRPPARRPRYSAARHPDPSSHRQIRALPHPTSFRLVPCRHPSAPAGSLVPSSPSFVPDRQTTDLRPHPRRSQQRYLLVHLRPSGTSRHRHLNSRRRK